MEKPLVSICLKAYNQKDFIGEALEGVLAQTYRPLEIVICDDCSSDGTWEIIRERLAKLTTNNQSLTTILHRNEVNLGNCRNWEMCGKLAHGELLIKADGDDVSEPERVAKIVEAWVKGGKQAKVISSGCRVIDVGGRVIGEKHEACAAYPVGAMQAWTQDCFAGWPAIPETWALDDVVWCYRAMLLGEELVIPDLLVRYRVGCGVSTRGHTYRETLIRVHHTEVAARPICLGDVEAYLAKGGDKARAEAVRSTVETRIACAEAWLMILEGRFVWTRLGGMCRVWKRHGFRGHVLMMLFALPFHLGDPIVARLRKTA